MQVTVMISCYYGNNNLLERVTYYKVVSGIRPGTTTHKKIIILIKAFNTF